MEPLTFAEALTQLKTDTSQTANFTFTDDEITAALTKSWTDAFVVNTIWDESLSYVVGTWQYPLPGTLQTVKDVYIQKASDQYPEKINSDLWEVVDGNLQFFNIIQNYLDDTYTLYLKGNYKLTTDDSLQTEGQVNYVLTSAAYILLRQLSLKSAFVFLRNDISMSDIIRAKTDLQNDKLMYKQALLREYESA